MSVPYDNYYQTENLFGEVYPELINFFVEFPLKGKVLDLGCGQGRDAIPLARLGYTVTGIDQSKVGIEQMNQIAENENLTLSGEVADIFEFEGFDKYNLVLLNSIFHFTKNDQRKETEFIKRIISKIKKGCLVVFCIQDSEQKVNILNETIDFDKKLNRLADQKFEYSFEDQESGHKSKTDYRMIVIEK